MSARRPPRARASGLFGLLCLFGAGAAPGAPERTAPPAPPEALGTPGDLPSGGSGSARTATTPPPRGAAPAGPSPPPAGCAPGERRLDASTAPSGEPCGAGRLFSTPEERLRLDALRRHHERRPAPAADPAPLPARPGPEGGRLALRLDGVVLRSLGTGAAWVNGERVFGAGSTREGVRVLGAEGGGVRLALPGGAATVRLRAGQHVDLATGRVREGRQAGGDPSGNAAAAPPAPAGAARRWEE